MVVHEDPDHALSDGPNSLPIEELPLTSTCEDGLLTVGGPELRCVWYQWYACDALIAQGKSAGSLEEAISFYQQANDIVLEENAGARIAKSLCRTRKRR